MSDTIKINSPPAFDSLTLEEQSTTLINSALRAAPSTKQDQHYRKEYLTEPTKSLIERIASTSPDDQDLLQKLRKAVKKRTRKDKKQHLCNQLLQDSIGPPSKQWSTLKYLRKDYVPRTQGIRKPNGQMSTKANKPEVLATHLEKNVWNSRALPSLPTAPIFPEGCLNSGAFTEQELMMALSRLKLKFGSIPPQCTPCAPCAL